jgi:(1->4)-alpha-D-glucan 1-alpha-D-glucosylmutase
MSNLLGRIQDHLVKATREAMVHTRWTRPNQPHEDALRNFATSVMAEENREFLDDFHEFHRKIAYLGMINALSQALLKITSPGVADFYQGSELWHLRLVDPDNRGPIDFAKRESALKALVTSGSAAKECAVQDLMTHWEDGRIKLYLIWKSLTFRRAHPELFLEAEFVPLAASGCYANNVVAFLRRRGNFAILVAVPRWLSQLRRTNQQFDWCDTRLILPPGCSNQWKSILTPSFVSGQSRDGDNCLFMNDLSRDFPLAFLEA